MLKCRFSGCDYKHKHPYGIKHHEKFHSSDPKVRHPHACQYCEYRSGSKYKLKEHVLQHTEGKKFICPVSTCEYSTHNKEYFRRHERMHDVPEILCSFKGCSYKSKSKSCLKAHFTTRHSGLRERKIDCPLCSKLFYNLELMQNHLKSHTREKPWKCSLCSFETPLPSGLNHHLEAVHNEHYRSKEEGRLECKLCNFTTSFSKQLKRHLASHSDERPFACAFPGCNYRYKRKDSLRDHTISFHTPEMHHCPEPGCTYVTKSKKLMWPHRKVHSKLFPCVFPTCERQFHNEVALLNHQKLHDPNRQFPCNHCPQRFLKKYHLIIHRESVHIEEKQLQCPYCSKVLHHRQNLRLHVRKLHREMDFGCKEPGCTYRSFSLDEISEHARRWHDKNRPFKCEYCAYRLTRKDHLDGHRIKCPRNPKTFSANSASKNCPAASDADFQRKICYSVFDGHKSYVMHSIFHRVARVILTRLDVQLQ